MPEQSLPGRPLWCAMWMLGFDEPRLRSEARALQALAACLPRGDLRFARRVYRLEFE